MFGHRNRYVLPRKPWEEKALYWGGILLESVGFGLMIGISFLLVFALAAGMGKL
jgi:hypothetical protein